MYVASEKGSPIVSWLVGFVACELLLLLLRSPCLTVSKSQYLASIAFHIVYIYVGIRLQKKKVRARGRMLMRYMVIIVDHSTPFLSLCRSNYSDQSGLSTIVVIAYIPLFDAVLYSSSSHSLSIYINILLYPFAFVYSSLHWLLIVREKKVKK